MPSFPLVDSHVHLWDPHRLRYDWLAGVPALNHRHGVAELREAIGKVAVGKFVFVQCECAPAQSLAEAAWVTELAADEPRLAGIVAQAPLERGRAVAEVLAELAARPLVKGVRRLLQEEEDAFALQPDFVAGVRELGRHGLTFDVCIYHRQLPAVVSLVEQCPEVRFVLDHLGKPGVRDGCFEPWARQLRALSQRENVWCKLSGLTTEADPRNWTPDHLRPYLAHAIDCFGLGRVMFGSDWPVSSQATAYVRWVETVEGALVGCSDDDLHRVFVRNAEAFYGI